VFIIVFIYRGNTRFVSILLNATRLRLWYWAGIVTEMLERKTTISTEVLHVLEGASSPLSVAQIMESLDEKGLRPNKTTVYRLMEKLIGKKAVSEISVRNGTAYYELSKGHHHHHFVCNECETVFCLDSCHVESHGINLSALLPYKGFQIQSHDFNLYGVCEPCLSR